MPDNKPPKLSFDEITKMRLDHAQAQDRLKDRLKQFAEHQHRPAAPISKRLAQELGETTHKARRTDPIDPYQ